MNMMKLEELENLQSLSCSGKVIVKHCNYYKYPKHNSLFYCRR